MYICHGLHEYMGRYEKLANHLKDNGILVFALDHGKLNTPSIIINYGNILQLGMVEVKAFVDM